METGIPGFLFEDLESFDTRSSKEHWLRAQLDAHFEEEDLPLLEEREAFPLWEDSEESQ